MRIILHLEAKQAEFHTDKAGDLHIFAKGLEPDLKPLPRKRGRKPRTPQVTVSPDTKGVPYPEPELPKEEADRLRNMVMDDSGWQ